MLSGGPEAHAAVSCPNPNPVVNENNCMGPGTSAWRIPDYSPDLGGFATQTSVNRGQNVTLKVGRNAPVSGATVDISVYRMGYYGGTGGRLVNSGTGTVNNDFTCRPMDPTTGKVDCGNWSPTYTVPGSALQTSGVYLATLSVLNQQTSVVFTVRDDLRAPGAKMLFVLPRSSYEAYNLFGGKSLYYGTSGGTTTASGTDRAVKVSFNRPLVNAGRAQNWLFGPDYNLLEWMEEQGYDVSYTDDVQASLDPDSLKNHDVDVISGHSEYWSRELFNGMKAARDAGVNIASFSGNTAYWKVRYEDGGQTLVCYKTVQGGGSGGLGSVSQNDWGPDGVKGTADDALGPDGVAGTADDNPQNATTTFRDNGAASGDPNAPPGGRVGPDTPENSLLGSMYVGDNDARDFPLTVPAANANDEFAGDRTWRNTGISTNTSTDIGTALVGWEWDAIPTQAQYLSRQPAGVKSVSGTNVQVASDNSWLQDEGRVRSTTPPPGQPGTVGAVKYTAPSGALVFAAGTMRWSRALSDQEDPRIKQATYNVFSDMGTQPDTPTGVTLDAGGSNHAPVASFTISSNPTRTSQTVTFNGSASSDADGTIAKYQWDLDGNGSFETDTGTNPVATKSYAAEGSVDVRLRVTDDGGATDLQVKTLTILDNQPPTAALTASPNPAVVGQTVGLDASGSADTDGTIARYEWDLDGNGTYETDTGATKTTSKAFTATGTVNVGVRVTDNGGKTATKSLPVTVNQGGVSNYGDAVLNTPGLLDYWRMGEASGTTFADSKGTIAATAFNGVTLGVPGGPAGDANTAARFDGSDDYAKANLDLSAKTKLTVEFWLKWTFANDDRLALEFTPNYNTSTGGFLVDPNAPQLGGKFAVGFGKPGATRNTAYFDRPTSGAWHHYAFVLDTTAPAAQQVIPYVDGTAVAYTKLDSGTGAPPFANSTLYMMSRAGTSLFGNGDLDEVAVYDRPLTAAQISEHSASFGANRRPNASFTASPNPVKPGQTVTLNASGSSDPDGTIRKYEWDLDGNGSFETDTGTTPSATKAYSAEGPVDVSLRVTDDQTGTDVDTRTVTVTANQSPTASFTASPNPAVLGQTATLDASGSSDPDGSIAKYEWDLDGNGSYETDTGTTKTVTRQATSTGTTNVGLRVTDDGGKASSVILPVTVNAGGVSSYGDAVLRTSGLVDYWRMGESSGTAFADSKGTSPASASGAVTLGVPGGVAGDPDKAARFDGVSGYGQAPVNLSSTTKVTVEFWLKWNAYANDDRLALELTPNFNNVAGGFLVDPNAPQSGGKFAVSIGTSATRNNVYFNRPSAGAWHHYAFVLDRTGPAAQQITPYVDGQAVGYTKGQSGTGSESFANANLYMMSRAGTTLFGGGDLDEVALYNRSLTASEVADHFGSSGTNRRPTARFTTTPSSPKPGQTVSFDASSSSDPDGTITRYEWDLDGNGTYETDTGTNPQASKSYASTGNVDVHLRVYDNGNGTDVATQTISVSNTAPTASFTASPNPTTVGAAVAFNASGSSDPDGTIAKYEWDLDGNGSFETDTGTTPTASKSYATTGSVAVGLRVTDDTGATATTTRTVTVNASGTSYAQRQLATGGLLDYWRMGDGSGTTLADAKGSSPAALSGGPTLAAPGAIAGDSDTSVTFDGVNDTAAAPVDLSATGKVTVEFWLKWNAFANDDRLAMEFTPNFNNVSGGFLIDPNATGSKFAISIGRSASRNTVSFTRPSAGVWHHYAIVFDSTAPAATQITPYLDGAPASYTKTASGTGAGNFANSTLYFMSRGGSSSWPTGAALFGAGGLDELSVYNRALTASEIASHYGG